MEDRLRTTLTRALGRAVTDDEYFQVKDRIQHHYRLLADDQPPLSETERMMEAGRRTAREMTAKAKATLAQLQQRAHEVDACTSESSGCDQKNSAGTKNSVTRRRHRDCSRVT
jgi:hypothetical protein